MSKRVAVRADDPSSLPKVISCHSRCVYTVQRCLENGVVSDLRSTVEGLKQLCVHENLAEILGVVQVGPNDHRLVSIAGEYTLGVRLDKLYSLNRSCPITEVEHLLRGVVHGVAHLHKNNIHIGTLHPGRVLIDSEGVPKVTDYIFSSLSEFSDAPPSFERQPARYIAPEIPKNCSTWGLGREAGDSWSIGVCFLELLTAPFNPWRPNGVASLMPMTEETTTEEIVNFEGYCRKREGCGNPAAYAMCLEKLRRRQGVAHVLEKLLQCVAPVVEGRLTPMIYEDELVGKIDTAAWGEGGKAMQKKLKKGARTAEEILAKTFATSDTDLGRVLSSLEAVKANLGNTKKDAMAKATSRMLTDVGLIESSLSLYTKIGKTADENALSLLRDKGMTAAQPRTAVPLLFRCVTSYSDKSKASSLPPDWRGGSATLIPLRWFAATTHTIDPEPIDVLEEIGGYSYYPVKGMEKDGHAKSKSSLRDTLLTPTNDTTDNVTNMRQLLIRYPTSRGEIVNLAVREGVPAILRAEVWKAVLGVPIDPDSAKAYYAVDRTVTTADDDQVAKDVPRCHQYDARLSTLEGRRALGRVLKTWVLKSGSITVGRYIQGMASLSAPFVALMRYDEPAAYHCFANLLNAYPYLACDPSSGYEILHPNFYSFIAYHDAAIWSHLKELSLPDDIFLSRLRTHFAHDLPLEKIYLIWDALLLGPKNLLYSIALAFLQSQRGELLACHEVTDATQIWKNSLLTVNIKSCVENAKRVLAETPRGVGGPPSYFDAHKMLHVRDLPCAWVVAAEHSLHGIAGPRTVVIDCSWRCQWGGHLWAPLHTPPTPNVVKKLFNYISSKPPPTPTTPRVVVLGISPFEPLWGRPMSSPYTAAPDLAAALCGLGVSGVVVHQSHPPEEPPVVRPPCVTENGCLPGDLPLAVWNIVLEWLEPEELVGLGDVCEGLAVAVAGQQMELQGGGQ